MADSSLIDGRVALPRYRLWLVSLYLLVIWAGFTAINGQVAGLYHDDGIYVAVAKSLAEKESSITQSLPANTAQAYTACSSALSLESSIRNSRQIWCD
jgi:hypothetical protein